MKEEWKQLLGSTWIKIVLAAIITIPMLYSGIFLGSMWDPYGNADKIPVAVVNEDHAVSYHKETLHVGSDLVKNLKKAKEMDFRFVSKQAAKQGLADGSYYMVITIPENFSANATTLLDSEPKKMELHYSTNPGTNYIATKMDETAIAKIKDSISATVTKTYADTLFSNVKQLSSGLHKANQGSSKLGQGLRQSADGNAQIHDNLATLANSTLTFQDGAATLEQGLQAYTGGVDALQSGSMQLNHGLTTLQGKAYTLANGANALAQGSKRLNQGVQTYTDGAAKIQSGANQLQTASQPLREGVDQLGQGVVQIQQAADKELAGLQQLSSALKDGQNAQAVKQRQALKQANTASVKQLQELQNAIMVLEKDCQTRIASNESILQQLDTILQNNTSMSSTDTQSLQTIKDSLASENANAQSLLTKLETVRQYSNGFSTVFAGDEQALQKYEASLAAVQEALDRQGTSADTMGLLQGMEGIRSGVGQLNTAIFAEQGLRQGIASYTNGVDQLHQGSTQLTEKSDQLRQGASALAQGSTQVNDNMPALQSGVNQLRAGGNSLVQGVNQLQANNPSLLQGASALANGSGQLAQGANQLYQGSTTLADGLKQLQNGNTTLTNQLGQGAKAAQVRDHPKNKDMLAQPVTTHHTEVSTVKDNGTAMAPYMMSVGLYVACMAFTLMYPLLKNTNQTKSGIRMWAGKASVMYVLSTVMAIVMIGVLMLVNGMAPAHVVQTFLMAILVSAAFMSMMVFFNISCGKIGSFIVLIFMVLQLGGAAGTYPIETSSGFFNAIHPFMPFSYSVHAFRSTLASGNALTADVLVFVGMIIFFSLCSILFYRWKASISEEEFAKTPLAQFH